MRAREPDIEGLLDRDGIKVGYAVYGDAPTAVVLAPAWLPVDSRMWKAQVPYLARYFRVITVEPRGNGRSDRPRDTAAYADVDQADDLVAALDAAGVQRAVAVGASLGAWRSILAVTRHPERFSGLIAISANVPHLTDPLPARAVYGFDEELPAYPGWAKYNQHYWHTDYPDFLRFFFGTVINEPHSTKQIEDCVQWGLGTDADVLVAAQRGSISVRDRSSVEALVASITCPVLVIHGDADECVPFARGERLAELTGAEFIAVGGGGHVLPGRHPVALNRWIRDFATTCQPVARRSPVPVELATATARRWTRALHRRRRVLYLSSPIGLGHARRDHAIVSALRETHPDIEVDWLAQHPVTAMLAARGERVHPASRLLASESAHWESEADEHDLHAFQSVRRMDEILVANFMVFADLLERETYDLWVGDEAWEVDHFLHENPELKRAPYVWLTDFVGWLPMPDGGPAEAALTADYNAEMIAQIKRFPRVRDRSLFVGNPDDVVPDGFGADLPAIRDWTRAHYDFTGYITGFDPAEIADREALRAAYRWSPSERICLVTVGGTGVGEHLLRRAIQAYPAAAARVPGLRMVVVTGPRIDPASLPAMPGLELHAYLPDLHKYLAACDLAVVQGGLTTTMELAAVGRPFLYVPLRHHFEQNFHVPHRLARYGAGRRLDYQQTDPEQLAEAIVAEFAAQSVAAQSVAAHSVTAHSVTARPVETDGAVRAAAYLADLL